MLDACTSIGGARFQTPPRKKLSFGTNMTPEMAAERAVSNDTPMKRPQSTAGDSENRHNKRRKVPTVVKKINFSCSMQEQLNPKNQDQKKIKDLFISGI